MTRRDIVAATACLLTVATVAACGETSGGSQPNANVGVCGGQLGVASGRTARYTVVLVAQPADASAAASPSGGPAASTSASATGASPSPPAAPDVVLSGSLVAVSGPGATHLELHICARATGGVATGLHPTVTLRNISAGSAPVAMPVAVMEGSGQGVNDLHYGNNVLLQPNATYAIAVRIDAGNAVDLRYQAPSAGPPVSPPPPNCLVNHQLC